MKFNNSIEMAKDMDRQDSLGSFRNEFIIPEGASGHPSIYLCGNSLGLQPKSAQSYLQQELDDWAKYGVEGHFHGKRPWFHYHKFLVEKAANIVGAKADEVAIMNQLTTNLHLMMVSFYRPKGSRYKILMEAGAFPSDMYAVQSQVEFHGHKYDDAVIEITPRNGEFSIRHEDILEAIETHKDQIALVFFSGVQYYTGQAFDIPEITKAAHKIGAMAGFDLAHAAGNLPLSLHEWDVDFAAWCTYKYLNSGPGNVSGVFIHERHGLNPDTPRFSGWWGHKEDQRFLMKRGFIPELGAAGWQLGNAPVFGMAVHLANLDIFEKAGIANLAKKTSLMTPYLRFLLEDALKNNAYLDYQIITPNNQPGCQISILTGGNGKALFDHLTANDIICDWREPNVIRMAPVPLYNSFIDCWKVGQAFSTFKGS
jgi:kynureninase